MALGDTAAVARRSLTGVAVAVLLTAGTTLAVAAAAVAWDRRRRQPRGARSGRRPAQRSVKLQSLSREEVPRCLQPEFYFDLQAHPFAHGELLASAHDVVEVLGRIHSYAVNWLEETWTKSPSPPGVCRLPTGVRIVGEAPPVVVEGGVEEAAFSPDAVIGRGASAGSARGGLHLERGAQVLGGTFDLRNGAVWLGAGAIVEPGVYIAGPAIIGAGTTVRFGAYIRGDVIIGDGVVLRGELKNAVVMDRAELAHPGYTGDSIIGYAGHFGCQALTANLGLFKGELCAEVPGHAAEGLRLELGRRKVGVILGDHSQLGCGTVTDPGTFLGPQTHTYPLTRLASGFYGPGEIVKNKPEESGALIREALRPPR